VKERLREERLRDLAAGEVLASELGDPALALSA
jgi:hypothetical protein